MNYDEIRNMPKVDLPEGKTAYTRLKNLSYQGAERRYETVTPEIEEKLDRELKVIKETGVSNYLLIVEDYLDFAKEMGFYFSIRGSSGNSLVVYCLGITNFDPLKYVNVFESFINPARDHIGKIGVDFAPSHRKRVLDYVAEIYGKDRVDEITCFPSWHDEIMSKYLKTINAINENHLSLNLKPSDIPLDDEKTYELICESNVEGTIALEEFSGFKVVFREAKPRNFNDFMHIPALYRPGPLDLGWTDKYIKRKLGKQKISYLHPSFKNPLKDTYGLCIYQEQIIKIAHAFAGLSMTEAEKLCWAMSKKNLELLIEYRELFSEAGLDKGLDKEAGKDIFDQIEPLGRHAASQPSSIAFGILSYQMVYLKAHYPDEFKDVAEE